jgi:ferredoxin-like protein FixX
LEHEGGFNDDLIITNDADCVTCGSCDVLVSRDLHATLRHVPPEFHFQYATVATQRTSLS